MDGDREAYAAAVARRDVVSKHRDDAGAVRHLEHKGIRVIKARGRIEGPGVLIAGGARIGWRDLVIATGAGFREPSIPGLAAVSSWTSEDFYSSEELPASAVIIGGGPVGCEIAQVLVRFGCRVTLVQHSSQLLSREEPAVAAALAAALREDGVDVRLGVDVASVVPAPGGARVTLDDGWSATAERVIVKAWPFRLNRIVPAATSPRPLPPVPGGGTARAVKVVPSDKATESSTHVLLSPSARVPLIVTVSPVFTEFLVQPSPMSAFGPAVAHFQLLPPTLTVIHAVGLTHSIAETVPLSFTVSLFEYANTLPATLGLTIDLSAASGPFSADRDSGCRV